MIGRYTLRSDAAMRLDIKLDIKLDGKLDGICNEHHEASSDPSIPSFCANAPRTHEQQHTPRTAARPKVRSCSTNSGLVAYMRKLICEQGSVSQLAD